MYEADLAIIILWTLLSVYSILGAIDFGTGFWSMVYANHETLAGKIANRFLSPTWEVTNTFLVFLVVAVMVFFPKAAFSFATAMFVPVTLILVLIVLRSSLMVFSHSFEKYSKLLRIVSGITGLLVPMLLIIVLPITEGGFISVVDGVETLDLGKVFSSPTIYAYMLFGLASELFLSALFLADFSRELGSEDTYIIYRRNALFLGPVALLMAIVALGVMDPAASWLMANLQDKLLLFMISLFCFILGYSALWWSLRNEKNVGWPRFAMIAIVLQYGIASFAYGSAHLPYIVYPIMTVTDGFTTVETFRTLLIVYAAGVAVLLPGFLIFWNVFLKNRSLIREE
ncbi:cytochrome d ubiquinol oxidase subunit II [Priestia taiwanensis]|uniref:Membrane protein n=1 Tax=Priestia taiwanensis TaxID=1347902 RepID=A0A917AVD1_9BACI|nr:cytochrome d ubiquinol oxidase subunit II [Priestia taiwanensis]MBM7364280.1 cytochrome d ubiquinol oxidase subunit II [Priestia taiwanensis]GGE73180.1 membrane protein [Priestia taiwanensis]